MVLRSGIRMHFMTGLAGPAFGSLIDMNKVEVFITVPEIGRRLGAQILKCGFIMTGKTEAVFSVRIGCIEVSGIIFHQDAPIVRAVRIMTSDAILLFYGTVTALVRFQERLHVHDLAPFRIQSFIMALQAELHLRALKQLRGVGKVGVMTVHAGLCIHHGAVFSKGLFHQRRLVRMAVGTERGNGSAQHCLIGRPVRVVTLDTGLLDRRMDGLLGLQAFLLIGMTGKANGVPLLNEPRGVIALVVVVTAGAVAACYRRVHDLMFHHAVRVALKTDVRHDILEHAFIGGLVRVVTCGAISSHNRRVHHLLFILRLVAHMAQIRALHHECNGHIAGMLGLLSGRFLGDQMAGRASVLGGAMNDLILAHGSMAAACNAGVHLRTGI